MNSYVSKILLVISFLLSSTAATAQLFLPLGLDFEEAQLFEVFGFRDTAYGTSISNTFLLEKAHEDLRRAGLLARCARLRTNDGDSHQFDPEIKASLQRVIKKINAGLLPFEQSLDVFKLRNREVLWALSVTSEADKKKLFAPLQSIAGKKLLQHHYAGIVLVNYRLHTVNINTGMNMVAAPIHLKTYFIDSGQLPYLDQIVSKLTPEVLVDFRNLKSIESYTLKDKGQLEPLSDAFDRKSGDLEDVFYSVLEKSDLDRLNEFYQNDFFRRLGEAKSAQIESRDKQLASIFDKEKQKTPPASIDFSNLKLGDTTDPRYNAYILMLVNQKFPMTPEFEERMYRVQPRDLIDNEHLTFCPEIQKK